MRNFKLPWLLFAIHSAVIILAAFVDPNWDDMNPSIILLMALHCLDYPIHIALGMPQISGGYLFLLLFIGGALWYAIGFVISATRRGMSEITKTPTKPVVHSAEHQSSAPG